MWISTFNILSDTGNVHTGTLVVKLCPLTRFARYLVSAETKQNYALWGIRTEASTHHNSTQMVYSMLSTQVFNHSSGINSVSAYEHGLTDTCALIKCCWINDWSLNWKTSESWLYFRRLTTPSTGIPAWEHYILKDRSKSFAIDTFGDKNIKKWYFCVCLIHQSSLKAQMWENNSLHIVLKRVIESFET